MTEQRFSLLGTGECGVTGKNLRDDLLLNRFFRHLPVTATELSVFLETISAPPLSREEIALRQSTLAAFSEYPSMLKELTEIFDYFGQLRQNWDAERAKLFTLKHLHMGDKNATFYNARLSLQLTASYLKRTLSTLGRIAELLMKYRPELPAPLLTALQDECRTASSGADYRRIYDFADKIEEGILEASSYDVEAYADEELRLGDFVLADFRFTRMTERTIKAEREERRFSLFRHPDKNKNAAQEAVSVPYEVSAYLPDLTSELSYDILMEAVAETDRLMLHTTRSLLSRFSALPRELAFYRAASIYCKRMAERGVHLVLPTILPEEEARIEFHGVRDLILLNESLKTDSVVANDCILTRGGTMLIRGDNGTGKTVFLRSVGSAVLLGLGGLPVPAESAAISVRKGIFSLFASAEKSDTVSLSAGRFEEEVAALAAVVEQVTPSSLVLLNETFQSTAYAEGAAGILPVLEYVGALGGNTLFVTHLTELFTHFADDAGVLLAASSTEPATRFKILRLPPQKSSSGGIPHE